MRARAPPREPKLTERQVDDDVRGGKFAADVALGVWVVRGRGAPSIRIDRAGAVRHVRRDVAGAARPVPELYERRSALERVPVSEKIPQGSANTQSGKMKSTHHPPPLLLNAGP